MLIVMNKMKLNIFLNGSMNPELYFPREYTMHKQAIIDKVVFSYDLYWNLISELIYLSDWSLVTRKTSLLLLLRDKLTDLFGAAAL